MGIIRNFGTKYGCFMDEIRDFLKKVRVEYTMDSLDISKVHPDPVMQFANWMQLVIDAGVEEPNIMHLCTVSVSGIPSSRIVLLRNFDEHGFVFFTNYHSSKGRDMEANPHVALTFFWQNLHKQVRIEGTATKITDEESEEYFHSRPRESQIGAWASIQSQRLTDRKELEQKVENLTRQYEGKTVPRPLHWGGYRIKPFRFEFWQGRANRLHDRVQYHLAPGNNWEVTLLYP